MRRQLGAARAPAALGVIGNISRDRVIRPGGRASELLGGAALHVALAATRAGLRAAPAAVIGTDLRWIASDPRLAALDLSLVRVVPGNSCAFRLSYDADDRLSGTISSFGAAEELTRHALSVLASCPAWHVCCRRPLDAASALERLAAVGLPFSIDFNLASARELVPAAGASIGRASAVFVNTAELDILSEVTSLRDLALVVVSDGPRPAAALRRGQLVASATPPRVAATEVTGAGDVLAGTFLAAAARGLSDQDCLRQAVGAAADAVTRPGLVFPENAERRPRRVLHRAPAVCGARPRPRRPGRLPARPYSRG
ncbi:MAG TPA: carbohydrate kinase family protein [Trebonia sp.]